MSLHGQYTIKSTLPYSTIFDIVNDYLYKKYESMSYDIPKALFIDEDTDLPIIAAHLAEELLNLPTIRQKLIWLVNDVLIDYLYEQREITTSRSNWANKRTAIEALQHTYGSSLMIELADLLLMNVQDIAGDDIRRVENEFNRSLVA